MRFVFWNIAHVEAHWHDLIADERLDLALLQEATPPPANIKCETIPARNEPWITAGAHRRFCAAVVRLSDRVQVRRIPTKPLPEAGEDDLGVSLPGTLAACEVSDDSGETIVVASVYAAWGWPIPWTKGGWIYADASVHRLISDLSALVALQRGHKIIVAGDLNMLYGHGEGCSVYWQGRYGTVFTRMEMLGLPYVGPQHPYGEQASPWPAELPVGSKNVPTFRTRKGDPATATRQLDFVFASRDLVPRLTVRALNALDTWGPSDHCRVEIEMAAAS